MSDVDELYQSIILDHNRRPRNFGDLEGADRRARAKNPLCGDHVAIALRLRGDVIEDVRFRGTGCAISRASASVMTAAVKGKTRAEAEELFSSFHTMVTNPAAAAQAEPADRSLAVFAGVSRFPVRVKCATLPWHTLRAALDGEDVAPVSTEQGV